MIKILNSYWKPFRFIIVFFIGLFFILLTIYLNAFYLTTMDAKNIDSIGIMFTSMGIISAGMLVAIFFCKLIYNGLAFEGTVCLSKILRITEAMALLHAKSNKEKIHAINCYRIKLYKVKHDLGSEPVENINCKEISGFLSWLFYMDDKNRYLGYEKICCNYEDIQKIIKENQEKWGNDQAVSGTANKKYKLMEQVIARLQFEKNELLDENLSLKGRNSQLQTKENENRQQSIILIKLASHVTQNYSAKKKITKVQIKDQYLTLGKADGVTTMPPYLVDAEKHIYH